MAFSFEIGALVEVTTAPLGGGGFIYGGEEFTKPIFHALQMDRSIWFADSLSDAFLHVVDRDGYDLVIQTLYGSMNQYSINANLHDLPPTPHAHPFAISINEADPKRQELNRAVITAWLRMGPVNQVQNGTTISYYLDSTAIYLGEEDRTALMALLQTTAQRQFVTSSLLGVMLPQCQRYPGLEVWYTTETEVAPIFRHLDELLDSHHLAFHDSFAIANAETLRLFGCEFVTSIDGISVFQGSDGPFNQAWFDTVMDGDWMVTDFLACPPDAAYAMWGAFLFNYVRSVQGTPYATPENYARITMIPMEEGIRITYPVASYDMWRRLAIRDAANFHSVAVTGVDNASAIRTSLTAAGMRSIYLDHVVMWEGACEVAMVPHRELTDVGWMSLGPYLGIVDVNEVVTQVPPRDGVIFIASHNNDFGRQGATYSVRLDNGRVSGAMNLAVAKDQWRDLLGYLQLKWQRGDFMTPEAMAWTFTTHTASRRLSLPILHTLTPQETEELWRHSSKNQIGYSTR